MLSCKDLKTRRLETSETGARPGNFRFFSNVRNKISKTRSWRTRSEDEFENFSEKKPVFVKWHAPGERGRALTRVPLWAEAPPSKTHIPNSRPPIGRALAPLPAPSRLGTRCLQLADRQASLSWNRQQRRLQERLAKDDEASNDEEYDVVRFSEIWGPSLNALTSRARIGAAKWGSH